ncbi:DNA polymerase III subunit chi [Ramlibacter sp. AW1]|uniref:DNA polymerase III subunit chi n=1 Tax=Ramlibacter aurantiacus TaxID=2801330 RepID=A0A937D4U1_9BURK|nr:DNA polymerase III subunit chi [Ramlibacter aurantiacus]MBL0422075.1 DNA polymerase III subunit chi [Ramlibacter aurantiacus]
MTEVAFHFNAPAKLAHACRLLRKAVGSGAQVVVTGDDDLLCALDSELWTFSPADFVPHAHLGQAPSVVVERSPVVLARSPRAAAHRQVLVNLGDSVPEGFEDFERLIEVVTGDEDDRQRARRRWKHYADRGLGIVRHDLKDSAG